MPDAILEVRAEIVDHGFFAAVAERVLIAASPQLGLRDHAVNHLVNSRGEYLWKIPAGENVKMLVSHCASSSDAFRLGLV
jgi:hypothetical protein